ncbi:MAG: hypothetical protein GC160_17520 [Acidobacteria bacterium]|nr:hypothetical protein [Acidobacteriota bacterium]
MDRDSQGFAINLHHEGEIAALADQLQDADAERATVVVLAGFPGGGRRYLQRQSVAALRRRGLRVFAAELDLDGAEPESLNLHAYWEFQQAKRGRPVAPAVQQAFERLAGRSPRPGLTELSLAAALAGLDPESEALVERLPAALADAAPWTALAAGLGDDERLALHVADTSSLPMPLREALLSLAMDAPHVKLLISSHRREGVGKVVRGRANVRFDVMPLDRGELEALSESRLERPGIPPAVYDRIHRESQGGAGAAARAITRLADEGLLAARPTGGWSWQGGAETSAAASLETALAECDAESGKLLASFVHLATLCGDNIPVKTLLSFLGVDDERMDEVIDELDESLGADSEAHYFAERFQHPSLPGEIVYGFQDAAVAYGLRESLSEATRQRLALELLRFLVQRVTISTQAGARLLAEVCRYAGADQNRRELELEMSWRVGPPDLEAFRDLLAGEIRSGQRAPAAVWTALNAGQLRWPPYRTLAVLDALAAVTDPASLPPAFFAIRSGVLLDLRRNEEAERDAMTGLARVGEDRLLQSALLERLGTAHKLQGREAEADEAYGLSRKLQEQLLDAGDERVVPVFQQAVQALEAAGRPDQAAELRRKLEARVKSR